MNQSKIADLMSKAEITSVLNSYFRALDQHNFDPQYFAAIFTKDAEVVRPNGLSLTGPEEISASHRQSFARFEGSQHFAAGHDISIDGNTATVRANLLAMHMWQGSHADANTKDNFFVAGGVIEAALVQVDDQWKISRITNAVVWRGGGFKDMLQTGRVSKQD
jgi:uncharacterized protein (TIGR02246 family)